MFATGGVKFTSLYSMLPKLVTPESIWEKHNAELIEKALGKYRSQLGFPKRCPEGRSDLEKFYIKSDSKKTLETRVYAFLKEFSPLEAKTSSEEKIENYDKYLFVYHSLHKILDEMKTIGLEILENDGNQATEHCENS